VTTPEYAPLLVAGSARWNERHQCLVKRLEQLLVDLAEPIDGPEATG